MKKELFYHKLVRDKIPETLAARNIICSTRTLEDAEYVHALNNKLREELEELLSAEKEDQWIEEIADLLEVMHALLKHQGKSFEEVELIRKAKQKAKGSFDKKIFLEKTESASQCTHEISQCLFCQIAQGKTEAEIVARFNHCYVIKDRFPVSKGHLLIIPNEHTDQWFTARPETHQNILVALQKMKSYLDQEYHPDGYNIGANCGTSAGQTVMHLHVHLIPRYNGDIEDPKGGVRGVIPSKQKY